MIKKNINYRGLWLVAKRKYFNLQTATIIVALYIAISWAWGALNMMDRNYKLQKELSKKQQELQLIEVESITLELEKKYYQTREYQELAARKNLGLVLPGEKVLILPPNTSTDSTSKKDSTDKITKKSNFQEWMDFLSGANVRRNN